MAHNTAMRHHARPLFPHLKKKYALSFDRNALPKRHMVGNLSGRRLRRGIVPGGVLIDLSPDLNVVIAGFAFPWASRMRLARFEIFAFDGIGRKVTIILHRLATVAFRENRSIPDGFRHGILLLLRAYSVCCLLLRFPFATITVVGMLQKRCRSHRVSLTPNNVSEDNV